MFFLASAKSSPVCVAGGGADANETSSRNSPYRPQTLQPPYFWHGTNWSTMETRKANF